MARLREYERKRSKGATPEPFGEGGSGSAKPIFVVQRHDARRLHYDFRLERDGALASWAVPKGVPLEPGQRHLAVHVEDHPLEYATFAGEIPAGQYGAGTVEIWDSGTYDLLEEKPDGGLTVRLEGKRLHGVWTLVPAKLDGDEKNWLLLRKQDDSAPAPRKRGTEYSPMLATLSEHVPSGSGWSYEVKWDGYRAIARVAGGEATLTSRRGLDMTERFAVVARALERAVRTPDVVLDGEVCALDEEGRASFSVMQQGSGPLVLYVFDVLEVDGEPVTDLPLRERRERLEEVVDFRDAIRLSSAFDDGEALFEAAKEQELEGIVAKKIESKYHSGPANPRLAQGEDPGPAGVPRRRLHQGPGTARRPLRLARPGRPARRRARVRRERRHRLHRGRDRPAAGEAPPAATRHDAVRRGAQDAQGAEGRCRLGRARAGRRGQVRPVDARRASACARVRRAPRGQGDNRRAP